MRAVVGQRTWTRHHAVALTTATGTHRPRKGPPARRVANAGRARGLVVKAAAPEAAPEADFVTPKLRIEVFPEQYEQLLDDKVARLRGLFESQGLDLPTIEVFQSKRQNFRMRAEFRVWHQGDETFYAMFHPAMPRGPPVRVDQFPMGSEHINELMPKVMQEVHDHGELFRKKLFQANFLTTLAGDAVVTLVYHKVLSDEWRAAAEAMAARLGVSVIGRSRKSKLVIGNDFVTERLTVKGKELSYKQIEGAFCQPNAGICVCMLEWALDVTAPTPERPNKDLLELYCGNGNFTLALARNFNRCVATEISKVSVRAAQYNAEANGIHNVAVVRMSAEEFSDALLRGKTYVRLTEVDIASHDFDTILVDPPRAGLDADSLAFVARFDKVVYISCNPETLARDLTQLRQTHHVHRFATFDQFPYTDHLESGAFLVRK